MACREFEMGKVRRKKKDSQWYFCLYLFLGYDISIFCSLQKKCERYWPHKEEKSKACGPFIVDCVSILPSNDYNQTFKCILFFIFDSTNKKWAAKLKALFWFFCIGLWGRQRSLSDEDIKIDIWQCKWWWWYPHVLHWKKCWLHVIYFISLSGCTK